MGSLPCPALQGGGAGDLGGLLPDGLTPGTRQLAGGQAASGLPVPVLLRRRPLGAAEGCEAWDPHPGLHPQRGFCPAGLQPQGGGQEGAGARRGSSFLPQSPPPLVCFNCILFLSLLLLFCNFFFLLVFTYIFQIRGVFLLVFKAFFLNSFQFFFLFQILLLFQVFFLFQVLFSRFSNPFPIPILFLSLFLFFPKTT